MSCISLFGGDTLVQATLQRFDDWHCLRLLALSMASVLHSKCSRDSAEHFQLPQNPVGAQVYNLAIKSACASTPAHPRRETGIEDGRPP
jgi:hypothetical protein